MSEFRVVEATGQPYPPHAQPCRTLAAALRRRDYYPSTPYTEDQVRSLSGAMTALEISKRIDREEQEAKND